MIRCWLISMMGCLASGSMLQAQVWSPEDSVRLAHILSGKDTLRLNPEFQRAIEQGTLINTQPAGKMQESKSQMPIVIDFSEYIYPDKQTLYDSRSPISIPQMPPQAAIRQPETKRKDELRVNPQAFTVPDAIQQGPTQGISMDFNHFLSYLFSKKYRRYLKNQQRAAAWKYNDLPTPSLYQKQKAFRAAHPELILKPDSVKPPAKPANPQPDGQYVSDEKLPVR